MELADAFCMRITVYKIILADTVYAEDVLCAESDPEGVHGVQLNPTWTQNFIFTGNSG